MTAVAVKNEDILDLLLEQDKIDPRLRDNRNWDVCRYMDFYAVSDWRSKIPHCSSIE